MKIPFTLEAWLKDKSQKVETRDGRIVHNIWPVKELLVFNGQIVEVCALIDGEEDAIVFLENGRYYTTGSDSRFDLFIITPEPELSEFEQQIENLLNLALPEGHAGTTIENTKRVSAELLELARKELEPEVLERLEAAYKNQDEVVYENGKRDGKAEALRTRATELTKNLTKLRLDTDSIPYHLIEFMCNLYTCQNWKEIEETAEAYVTRIKSAAMKDLPRWRKCADGLKPKPSNEWIFSIDSENVTRESAIVHKGYFLPLDGLEKLPGFNE